MALIRPKRNDIFLYMRMLYLRTEKSVVNELKRQQASGLVDYGTYAALMRIQQTLQEMQDESFTYVPEMVNKVFRDANARAGYEAAEALSVAQTAIVEQLTGNLLGCITEAAEQAYKTSESVLQLGRLHPDVFRNPVILSSALAEAEGRGMSPAVTRALHSLQNDNITSFVDKSGREWGLTEYCTMATRTVRTQATVAANLTSDDWDLWKITPNGSTCALCAAYEGRVYSKSGTNPDYPPLSTAFGKIDPAGGNDLSNTYLNIHPNCLHSLVRYTTAGRTDEEIQKDKDFSSFEKRPADVDYRTKKQIEEYREKERKRAEFLATRRQWNDYRERLGKEIPSLETFEKHKKAGDDKYKAWEKAYRKKGAELRKEIKENPPVIPPNPAPKPAQPKPVANSTILGTAEMPPQTWQFRDIDSFKKAEAEFISRHGDDQYFALRKKQERYDKEWHISGFDEDREAKMDRAIRFDDTISKLQERFPLPDESHLTIGSFDSVQDRLTATQRVRAESSAAAQAWVNPDTGEYVIGYNHTYGGTLADDLKRRDEAIQKGEHLLSVFEGDSAEGVAIHEYGHQMAEYIDNAMIYDDPAAHEYWDWYQTLSKEEIKNGVSVYATTNRAEFEAECFADLLTGTPRPIARKYGEFLKRCAASNYTIKGGLTGKGTPVQLNFNRGK